MRNCLWVCVMVIVSFSSLAFQAEESAQNTERTRNENSRIISDDLFIFMHTGPGRQYRILGSVEAGTSVVLTDKEISNDFIEIIDAEGRTGWVEASFVRNGPSRRELMETFQQQAADAQATLIPLREEIASLNSQIEALKSENAQHIAVLNQTQSKLTKLEADKQQVQHDQDMKTLMTGGGLVAGGILLGVVLAFLPKRRKRNDGWMN